MDKLNSLSKGFTLIELMIVVAVVAILVAIAMPQYQNYMVRAKITEAFSLAAPVKLAVSEVYQTTGSFPSTNTAVGLPDNITGKYVKNINVEEQGAIKVTFNTSDARLAGKNIKLIPHIDEGESMIWDCASSLHTPKTDQYLPAECRH